MTPASETAPLQGLDVLVVEDETPISLLIEDMLVELGAASVGIAGSLTAGTKLATARRFALALLDVNLAGELVYPLAEKLKQSEVPFVFVTGYGGHGLDPRWKTVAVLQKPFTIDMLERTLRRAIN